VPPLSRKLVKDGNVGRSVVFDAREKHFRKATLGKRNCSRKRGGVERNQECGTGTFVKRKTASNGTRPTWGSNPVISKRGQRLGRGEGCYHHGPMAANGVGNTSLQTADGWKKHSPIKGTRLMVCEGCRRANKIKSENKKKKPL